MCLAQGHKFHNHTEETSTQIFGANFNPEKLNENQWQCLLQYTVKLRPKVTPLCTCSALVSALITIKHCM